MYKCSRCHYEHSDKTDLCGNYGCVSCYGSPLKRKDNVCYLCKTNECSKDPYVLSRNYGLCDNCISKVKKMDNSEREDVEQQAFFSQIKEGVAYE